MAKTKEESNILKEKIENLNKDLSELTEDDLTQVVGGIKIYKENQKFRFAVRYLSICPQPMLLNVLKSTAEGR